jgi:histidinol-phosphate phosphatase family protein
MIDKDWTLFLDRDGVINVRNFEGYITRPSDFQFLPNAKEGLKHLAPLFRYIVVVTNQQGVAKGIMTKDDVDSVHHKMLTELDAVNCKINSVFVATNRSGAENDRRKPNPSMAYEAQKVLPEINFEKSLMVGDTNSDILFGKRLGMITALVRSEEHVTEQADFFVTDLLELYYKIKELK